MNAVASVLLLIISFLLQSTLFSQFTIVGVVPNLLIIVVASIGFLVGRKYGLIVGFAAGMLVDVFFGSVIGIYALLYMYTGFINGLFKKILYPNDFRLPLGLIVGSDIIYGHACYIVFFLLKGDFHYFYYLRAVILPEVVYTTVIACILYPIIQVIFRWIARHEEKVEETIG